MLHLREPRLTFLPCQLESRKAGLCGNARPLGQHRESVRLINLSY